MLELAYQDVKDTTCPKCGNPLEVCTDEDTADRWQPATTTCYATQARDGFLRDHLDLEDSELIGVRLLPAGETAQDPLVYDEHLAMREHAAMRRRFGLD